MQRPDTTANAVARLEHGDVTATRQELLGGRESGHAGANNYDIGVLQVGLLVLQSTR